MWPGGKKSISSWVKRPDLSLALEQDGPPERRLKDDLAVAFSAIPSVRQAYLLAVSDEAAGRRVILGISSSVGESTKVLQASDEAFKRRFNSDQSLDIMFLSPEDEVALRLPAFYERR